MPAGSKPAQVTPSGLSTKDATGLWSRIGVAAGRFWIRLLFFFSRRAPWLVRLVRPIFTHATWGTSPYIREVTRRNARRILGPGASDRACSDLGRQVVAEFITFVCEVGQTAGWSRERLLDRISEIEGRDAYLATRRQGRAGAILVTAHLGSFEVGLAAITEIEPEAYVVFRRDGGLFESLRQELRQRLGVREAPVDDGLALWAKLRTALEDDAVVLIQGDRVMPGQRGTPTPFFDGMIDMPPGPVKLAMLTGSPIIPVFALREPDGRVRIVLEEAIRVPEEDIARRDAGPTLRRIAGVIERHVRQNPQQWLALHDPWVNTSQP